MDEIELPLIFRLAKASSTHSQFRIKMGCVILKHGKPVGWGFNKLKSHRKHNTGLKCTIHAEVSAMLSTGKERIPGSVAVIYRENKGTFLPALARPCQDCLEKLQDFGIKRILYSTNEYPYFEVENI